MEGLLFFIVFVGVLAFVIQKLAKAGVRSIDKYQEKQLQKEAETKNPYINRHKVFVTDNDKNYTDYLRWCEKHNQIPMNKDMYIKDIKDKEKHLQDLINSL